MKDFKKTAGAAGIFALIYTFCMYRNTASITFPILMVSGIWFLYAMQERRKIFDNKISSFYTVGILLTAVSVCMTGDWKLIFMSKMAAWILYICLTMEIYFDDKAWNDMKYVSQGIRIFTGSIGKGFHLLGDYSQYKEEKQEEGIEKSIKNQEAAKVIKGILIALPLLLIIIPLMMSADIIFEDMIKSLFNLDEIFYLLFEKINIIGLGFTFLGALILYYGFLKFIASDMGDGQPVIKKYGDKITGITVSGIICFLYVIFSMIQIRGILFSNVKLPKGYTYAEYAREGFFQLFILAVINMMIVLICSAKYEYSRILNMILYLLCVCTYVMIFSSTWKMILYVKVYNLTFLRVMVLWSLAVIAVIMIAVIRYIYSNDFSLFKFMAVVVTSFYMIIAFAKPDYIVAKYNLEYGNQLKIDGWYLKQLSSDAAPVLVKYMDRLGWTLDGNYFIRIEEQYKNMSIRTFNFSGYAAINQLEKR